MIEVEDRFSGAVPDFARIGVTVTDDVAGYERAKLCLLNTAHSALAYLGSLSGIETVADAMRDAALAGFVETLVRKHVEPNIAVPAGFDVDVWLYA